MEVKARNPAFDKTEHGKWSSAEARGTIGFHREEVIVVGALIAGMNFWLCPFWYKKGLGPERPSINFW